MKLLLFLILFQVTILKADNLHIEFFSFTLHVSENAVSNGEKYPRKIDAKGYLIIMPGIKLSYEKIINKSLFNIDSVKFTISAYSDSRARNSGFLHFAPRWKFGKDKFALKIGIGPLLFFRKSWRVFDDYKPNPILNEKYGYEYIFAIFGDIDLIYKINKNFSLIWSVIPAIPYSVANSTGIIYNF